MSMMWSQGNAGSAAVPAGRRWRAVVMGRSGADRQLDRENPTVSGGEKEEKPGNRDDNGRVEVSVLCQYRILW